MSNLPPDCSDADVERAFGGRDTNEIAERVVSIVDAACQRSQKKRNSMPFVDVHDSEYACGNVNLVLTLTLIDPENIRALGHRLLSIGREILES